VSSAGLTATEMAAALRRGEVTPGDLLDDARAQVSRLDSSLNAFLALTHDLADSQAERAARMLRDDPAGAGPLCGIPVALKDVLCVEGYPTTAGSRILENFRPPYTATAVERLLDAGVVPVGKTNCDEFAMGSSTENSAFGPVGNPWDVERVPGGSSGGSAAAVGAGMVPIGFGTDTGGSIRQPASLSGVVGFKPSYGRVSRYGLIAFASSLDQIGPFAHTVEDAAAAYAVVAGNDPRDSTTVSDVVDDPLATLRDGVRGMRLGVPHEYMGEGLEAGVRDRVTEAIRVLEELGATVTQVSLPSTDLGLSTYYILAPAECSSNLARYDGVRFGRRVERPSLTETFLRTRGEGFGREVKRRVMLGTYALSSGYYDAYYRRAQRVRTLIAREFDAVFEEVDALVCPTSPKVAFTTGAIQDPVEMYLNDALTIPVNLAGLPGISLPCGFSAGLPVGLQVIAPRLCDARVFQVAAAYEGATEWHLQRSPLVAA
jgi:aspartyl-tRNA(Asn)/glutamyl-tRNA(Gln) amidotransferase subunit A